MTVTPLRPGRAHTPSPAVPVDLGALTGQELLVIFYASGIRWHSHRQSTYPQLASIVVAQINRLGLDVIQEIARQVQDAVEHCQWHTYEALLSGPDHVSDARMFAHKFCLGRARAAHTPDGAVAVWKHALSSDTQAVAS